METWRRTTVSRKRTTAEKARGIQGHDQEQVSSNGDGGERRVRGDGQEGSGDASEEWSGESAEDSAGLKTEEEATTAGGAEGVR